MAEYPWEEARAVRQRTKAATAAIHATGAGNGSMGLTPDSVKATAAYRAAKRDLDIAVSAERAFNSKWADAYKRIPMEERMRRIQSKDALPAPIPVCDAQVDTDAAELANAYKTQGEAAARRLWAEKTKGLNYGQQVILQDKMAKLIKGKATDAANEEYQDLLRKLGELDKVKPRPLAKLYGSAGPTPQQKAEWEDRTRAWNRETSAIRRKLPALLEKSNAEFRARQTGKATDAVDPVAFGRAKELWRKVMAENQEEASPVKSNEPERSVCKFCKKPIYKEDGVWRHSHTFGPACPKHLSKVTVATKAKDAARLHRALDAARLHRALDAAMDARAKDELVMWGIPKGETERYKEVLLLSNGTPEKVARVKELATRDGFHSFRTANVNLGKPPSFGRNVLGKDARAKGRDTQFSTGERKETPAELAWRAATYEKREEMLKRAGLPDFESGHGWTLLPVDVRKKLNRLYK